ncbi:MAG: DUF1330 domain-containing protein [Saprospiraceae bacterium]
MNQNYIDVTQEAGKAFFQRGIPGAFVMLNLLKFKDIADYSKLPDLAPASEISGAAAYDLYMHHTLPLLVEAGSELLFYGKGGPFLIGPENQHWDAVLLVKHQSVARFMAFAQDQVYLKTAGHRTAALEDSRLLPIEPI